MADVDWLGVKLDTSPTLTRRSDADIHSHDLDGFPRIRIMCVHVVWQKFRCQEDGVL